MFRPMKKNKRFLRDVVSLRETLPVLNAKQVRRFKIPYYEALVYELDEDGFPNSAEFLRQLFAHQESYRKEHSYDVIIQNRLVLSEVSEELDYLYEGLKRAETAHVENNTAGEIDELLKISYRYAFGIVDWWWLAEQFFHQVLNIAHVYKDDDLFRRTMTFYIYGKYLVEQTDLITMGKMFLNMARTTAEGKQWSASKISGRIEKYIFVEVCILLYHTLVNEVNYFMKTDPEKAMKLCLEARQRGMDACIPRADIMFLQGQCTMEIGQPEEAVGSFMKAFLLYKTNGDLEQCCEAMLCLAKAYEQMNRWGQCKEQLENLLTFAESNGLKNYMGQAYLNIGQYFLNLGTPELASPYLGQAFDVFHELNNVPCRELVKNLGAVSKGQETFGDYVKLILRCEKKENAHKQARNIKRLLDWKNARVAFWEDMTESIDEASTEIDEVSTETGEEEAIDEYDTATGSIQGSSTVIP